MQYSSMNHSGAYNVLHDQGAETHAFPVCPPPILHCTLSFVAYFLIELHTNTLIMNDDGPQAQMYCFVHYCSVYH